MSAELIFVYNADSGLFSQVTEFAHKVISPQTYECNLCALTYGPVAMKNEWKEFLKAIPYQKTFLHRDEFIKKFPDARESAFPSVYLNKEGKSVLLLSAEDINAQEDLLGLKHLIQERLKLLIL